jgi:GNAT superfamily N-acetyltransferase
MIEELIYPSNEIPPHLKWQILSFLRMEWPEGFTGPNRLRDWISRDEDHPISLMLVDKNILISHSEVLWKHIEIGDHAYKIYGLAGVLTHPGFRGQGFGSRVVALATDYIDKRDADFGVVFTQDHLKDFYARCGWEPMQEPIFLVGRQESPVLTDHLVLMRFLSEKGKKIRKVNESEPVYFGEDDW